MRIVTDSGTDVGLSAKELADLDIHVVPLSVMLEGKSYREGVDISTGEFYKLLAATNSFPTTSQPSAGDFAQVYRRLAIDDPDILSIHISSGLSGTLNAAKAGAEMVSEAKVTLIDTKTLSAAAGWQVIAAARSIKAGWTKENILRLLERIKSASESLYTLDELKYLIHGGRISHMKGLIASLLNIKPQIGVEKTRGTYVQLGQSRSFKRAVEGLVDLVTRHHREGSELRTQVLHAYNHAGAHMLYEIIDKRFKCHWLPIGTLSFVLGAHTGTSMVGVAYSPQEAFSDIL